LGKTNPQTLKTSKNGVFVFPKANLQDTLYVRMQKSTQEIQIALNGYNYLTVTLMQNDYQANQQFTPDAGMLKILARERNKMLSSVTMNKEEIEQTHCLDIFCLLRRMSGVTVQGESIRIRGISSVNSSNEALIVVDGIPNDMAILNSIPIQNIEEISVLKEASIFGARGANGAVIIRTVK
jgi:outer membrane receptor for Fe3+-dicitrate